jgi:hypothetical protein
MHLGRVDMGTYSGWYISEFAHCVDLYWKNKIRRQKKRGART